MEVVKRSTPGSVAELAKLLDQEGTGGRGRRSALTSWLWAQHDEFAAAIIEKREPNWTKVAAYLVTMGLSDGAGRPLTGDRVRRAWWNVRQMKTRTLAKRGTGAAAPVMAKDEIAQGVKVSVNHESNSVPTQVTRSPSPAPSPAHASTANHAMQRLDDQMHARSSPMPQPVRR